MKKTLKMLAVAALLTCAAALVLGCSCSSDEPAQGDARTDESIVEEAVSAEEAALHDDVTLQVLADDSFARALEELEQVYADARSWVTFAPAVYAAPRDFAGALASADADLVVAPTPEAMDAAGDAVAADTRATFATADLVMVTAAGNEALDQLTIDDIGSGAYRVAVGQDDVPAGNYANQALSTTRCFNDPAGRLGSESAGRAEGTNAYAGTPIANKVITAASDEELCRLAASGGTDVAFVYASDVPLYGEVKSLGAVDANTHARVTFPAALSAAAGQPDEAAAFLDWCRTSDAAARVLAKWGFAQ